MKMCFYLQPGKRKAKKMLRVWSGGAQSQHEVCIVDEQCAGLRKGYTPVFYGVHDTTIKAFNGAANSRKPWLYIDNQYFGYEVRMKYFRVTWNALQHTGIGKSDGHRLRRIYGLRKPPVHRWRKDGRHVLVTLQSELYFKLLMPYTRQQWLNRVVKELKKHTDRPIIIREKPHPSRPFAQTVPFEMHLKDCYAIVTLNSATAIEGIMRGIPAFVTDLNCAIVPGANVEISKIEEPTFFERQPWLEVLADNQWSMRELHNGMALRTLKGRTIPPAPSELIQRSYKIEDIK